jgi:hypothetical protein
MSEPVGYLGWLKKEDRRLLRQVEREVYPTVEEMRAEAAKVVPRRKRRRSLAEADDRRAFTE